MSACLLYEGKVFIVWLIYKHMRTHTKWSFQSALPKRSQDNNTDIGLIKKQNKQKRKRLSTE